MPIPISILEVIQAANRKDRIVPSDGNVPIRKRFTLRTSAGRHLNESDASKIEEFLEALAIACDVKLTCIGGGHGCVVIELVVEDKQGTANAVDIIEAILSRPNISGKAIKLGFKIIINSQDKRQYEIGKDRDASRSRIASNSLTTGTNSQAEGTGGNSARNCEVEENESTENEKKTKYSLTGRPIDTTDGPTPP